MAKFVEEGGDLIVGQQGRLASDRRSEIADKVGNRLLQLAAGQAPAIASARPDGSDGSSVRTIPFSRITAVSLAVHKPSTLLTPS